MRSFTINLVGDVMLGRLIDQLFPTHVDEPSEEEIILSLKHREPSLRSFNHLSPWGNALEHFQKADLNLINLETSVTTHSCKWPDKVFNYRMHPENIGALGTAKVSYAGLANNHTLDFSQQGLSETIHTLREALIPFAGAGETASAAREPAILRLPNSDGGEHEIHVYAASDHPSDWHVVPGFRLIDYSPATKSQLRSDMMARPKPALKIVSVHWGPNYSWQPAKEITDLAHWLIDECEVDLVYGHSSHHVQGIEVYKERLILYGCGDFVDDYAVVEGGWRNDLSALWTLKLEEVEDGGKIGLKLAQLEIRPNRIQNFQAHLLDQKDQDHLWVVSKVKRLSLVDAKSWRMGSEGQLIHDLS